jgi:hypothetical protein
MLNLYKKYYEKQRIPRGELLLPRIPTDFKIETTETQQKESIHGVSQISDKKQKEYNESMFPQYISQLNSKMQNEDKTEISNLLDKIKDSFSKQEQEIIENILKENSFRRTIILEMDYAILLNLISEYLQFKEIIDKQNIKFLFITNNRTKFIYFDKYQKHTITHARTGSSIISVDLTSI